MSLLFWLATAATNWPHWATLTVVCMNVMRGLIARLSLPLAGLTGITRIWGNKDESIVLAGYYGNELAALGYSTLAI